MFVEHFGAFCSVCYSFMVYDRELVRSVVFLQAFVSVCSSLTVVGALGLTLFSSIPG